MARRRRGAAGGPSADPRALEAIASPARQEILAALASGPATVRDLAARLGRSRQALYYHCGVLVRSRLVRVEGFEGAGRDRERVYALATTRVAVGARAGSPRDVAAAERAVGAMLRLTAREVRAALASRVVRRTGARRELAALRAKVRLSAAELGRLNGLIGAVEDLLVRAKGRSASGNLISVTLVMTPSRESAAASGRESGR